MKKTLYLIIATLIFSSTSFSQKNIKLILLAGFNYTSLDKTEQYENFQTVSGFTAGAELEIAFTENFIFGQGLKYSQRNYKTSFTDFYSDRKTSNDLTLNYMSFQLKLKYSVPFKSVNLIFYGGALYSFFLSGENKVHESGGFAFEEPRNYEIDLSEHVETDEFGLLIGNGVSINILPYFSFVITGEYMFSISDYTKDNDIEDYFRTLSFQFGTSFRL